MLAGVRTQNEGVCSMCGQMPHAEALSVLMVVAVFLDSDFFLTEIVCMYVCVHVCEYGHKCAMIYLWSSENNLRVLCYKQAS